MLIVHVFVRVKPDQVEAFKAATRENARGILAAPIAPMTQMRTVL